MIKSIGVITSLVGIVLVSACSGSDERSTADIASEEGTEATAEVTEAPQPRVKAEKLEPSQDIPINDPAYLALPKVRISTSWGDITVALYEKEAPVTVENFLQYVQGRQYTRTIFHRVIPGFMIQGGGFSIYLEERATKDPISYEGDNGLKNDRGTMAMARTADPNSAAAQWYINLEDNAFLNHGARRPGESGYTVFGRVLSGMNVVDAIALVETGEQVSGAGQVLENVPLEPVIIEKIEVIE